MTAIHDDHEPSFDNVKKQKKYVFHNLSRNGYKSSTHATFPQCRKIVFEMKIINVKYSGVELSNQQRLCVHHVTYFLGINDTFEMKIYVIQIL